MNDLDEILDFEEAVDFNLSDNPEALDVEILDEDGLFNLGEDIGLENNKQLDEGLISLEGTKDGDNSKTQNNGQLIELDNNLSSGATQPQIEHSEEVAEFNLDDPDFLKEYEDTNGGIDNEVNIDEEFWKGLDVDPSDTSGKEGNKEPDLPEKLGTNNSIISTLPSKKENTLKSSSDIDVTNDGGRRNNEWNQGNTGGEFFNGGMSAFRSGYGPGLDGMSGIPIGQMSMGNSSMIPNLSNMPGPMIGPNIHVNPNFARLRPHALPFINPMTQYHMGAGGHPMNMIPYQGQMEMPHYHSPMGGRGNNAFMARGVNPVFGHHNNSMSTRKPANQQSNMQRTTQATPSKRKAPNDGFDQKEQDNKKTVTTNGKPQTPENKSTTSPSQKNVDRAKTSSTTTTAKNSSNSIPEKPSKPGISSPTTNKTLATKLKRRTDTPPSESTSASKSMQDSKLTTKSVPKTTPNSLPEAVPSKSSSSNANGPMANGTNKLTIDNLDGVNKRELQTMAGGVPGGFTSVTVDRVARTAEIIFKTVDGAKMFRRKYN
ncbi:11959_t:CDS:2, partial [Gigaspora margarita]